MSQENEREDLPEPPLVECLGLLVPAIRDGIVLADRDYLANAKRGAE